MRGGIDRLLAFGIKEGLSRHTRFRGASPPADGRVTLVSVNYHTDAYLRSLLRSFRVFVDAGAPVVVVDNSGTLDRAELEHEARGGPLRLVSLGGANIGHGLGLDLALRFVDTEFTLVCDPDTAIVSRSFWPLVHRRLLDHGVAGADTGNRIYHPLCLAFRTGWWKEGGFSFLHRWPWWDVGGELTSILGGIDERALLRRTRWFGPPLPSTRPGQVHHLGEVYEDAFTSTYLSARLVAEPRRADFDGWPRGLAVEFHTRWAAWVRQVLAGEATVADFPGDRQV